jgi:transposase InsO family protein
VSERALRSWRALVPGEACAPQGQRPHPATMKRHAMKAVARARKELRATEKSASWRAVSAHVGRAVPVRLVQRYACELDRRHRRRVQKRLERERVSVTVLMRDVVWCLDATFLGRADGKGVWGEVVKDVATAGFLALSIGPAATAKDVIALLERLRKERGGLPLVLVTDNGPAYRSRELAVYLHALGVLHLFSLPRTPQHNAWAERGMREIKEATPLGAGRELEPLEVARAELVFVRGGRAPEAKLSPARDQEWPLALEEACLALNERARPSRGGHSARQLDRILPHWDDRIRRDSFHRAAMEEIVRTTAAAPSERARRKAEREAIYSTLEAFGLVRRTRGGRPLPGPDSEGER